MVDSSRTSDAPKGAAPKAPEALAQGPYKTCQWQKSEDGLSCDVVQMPCDEEKTEKPPLKGCPPRMIDSSRTADAPKALAQGPYKTCQWQKSEDGLSCDVVQLPCDEEKTEKPPLKGCPPRSIDSSRVSEAPKALA